MWPHTECYTLEKFSCSVRLRFLVAVFLPKTSMSHQFAVCVIFIIMDSHSNKFRIYELVRENDLIIVARLFSNAVRIHFVDSCIQFLCPITLCFSNFRIFNTTSFFPQSVSFHNSCYYSYMYILICQLFLHLLRGPSPYMSPYRRLHM